LSFFCIQTMDSFVGGDQYQQVIELHQQIFGVDHTAKPVLNAAYIANGALLHDIYARIRQQGVSVVDNHLSNADKLSEVLSVLGIADNADMWRVLLPEYHQHQTAIEQSQPEKFGVLNWHTISRIFEFVKTFLGGKRDSDASQTLSSSTPPSDNDDRSRSIESSQQCLNNQNINLSDSSLPMTAAPAAAAAVESEELEPRSPTLTVVADHDDADDNDIVSPPPELTLLSARKAMSSFRSRNLDEIMLASQRKIYKNRMPKTVRSKTRKNAPAFDQCVHHHYSQTPGANFLSHRKHDAQQVPRKLNLDDIHEDEDDDEEHEHERSSISSITSHYGWKSREASREPEEEEQTLPAEPGQGQAGMLEDDDDAHNDNLAANTSQLGVAALASCSREKTADISMLSHVLENMQDCVTVASSPMAIEYEDSDAGAAGTGGGGGGSRRADNGHAAAAHSTRVVDTSSLLTSSAARRPRRRSRRSLTSNACITNSPLARVVTKVSHAPPPQQQPPPQQLQLQCEVDALQRTLYNKEILVDEYEKKYSAKCKELNQLKTETSEQQRQTQQHLDTLTNETCGLRSELQAREQEYETKCSSFASELTCRQHLIKERELELTEKEGRILTLVEDNKNLHCKVEFFKNRASSAGQINLVKSGLMRFTSDYKHLRHEIRREIEEQKNEFFQAQIALVKAVRYKIFEYGMFRSQDGEGHTAGGGEGGGDSEADIEAIKRQTHEQLLLKETDLETIKRERDELKSNLLNLNATYQKEKKQRKKLLEKVIDLQGNIRVFCRVRPKIKRQITNTSSSSSSEEKPEKMATTCFDDERLIINDETQEKTFQFDQVYRPDTNQQHIFEDVKPLIESCIDGYNVCIFAYGQTGSGKTYTMEGNSEQPGIIYSTFDHLFALQQASNNEQHNQSEMKIFVSCLEIYNEKIKDLLNKHKQNSTDLKAKLSKCSKKVLVPGLTKQQVTSTQHVREILVGTAYKNRSTGVTNMNEHSSRSHALVFVDVETAKASSRMVLIDLAGSERVKKTGVSGSAFDEARSINKSLSALGNVISALQTKQKHVPFRDSQLTYLLYDCLGGNSRALMFCNISCELFDVKESMNTLLFAHRVRRVQLGEAHKNDTGGGGDDESSSSVSQQQQSEQQAMRQKLKKLKHELQEREKEIQQLKCNNRSHKKEIHKLTTSNTAHNHKQTNHQQTRVEFNQLQKEHQRLVVELDRKDKLVKKLQSEMGDSATKQRFGGGVAAPRAIKNHTLPHASSTSNIPAPRHSRKRKLPSLHESKNATANDGEHNNNLNTAQHDAAEPAQKRRRIQKRNKNVNGNGNVNTNAAAGVEQKRNTKLGRTTNIPSYLQPTKNSRSRLRSRQTMLSKNIGREQVKARSASLDSNLNESHIRNSSSSRTSKQKDKSAAYKKKRMSSLDSMLSTMKESQPHLHDDHDDGEDDTEMKSSTCDITTTTNSNNESMMVARKACADKPSHIQQQQQRQPLTPISALQQLQNRTSNHQQVENQHEHKDMEQSTNRDLDQKQEHCNVNNNSNASQIQPFTVSSLQSQMHNN